MPRQGWGGGGQYNAKPKNILQEKKFKLLHDSLSQVCGYPQFHKYPDMQLLCLGIWYLHIFQKKTLLRNVFFFYPVKIIDLQ